MDNLNKERVVQPGEKYLVRFPEGMRDRIAEAAKANNRSMNAEIVARLESTFAERAVVVDPVAEEALLKNVQRLLEAREDELFRSLERRLEQTLAPYRVVSAAKD